MPAYAVLLLAVFVALPFVSHSPALEAARGSWAWYATYTSNILLARVGWQLGLLDITWSLAIEEQFYLVWPAVLRWWSPGRVRVACLAAVLGLPIVRTVAYLFGVPHGALDLLTVFRFDSLAWGALLAFAEPAIRGWTPTVQRRVGLIALACALVATGFIARGLFWRDAFVVVSIGHTMLAVASAGLIALCLAGHSITTPLSVAPLRAVGRVSYGFYLFHPLTLALTDTIAAAAGLNLGALTSIEELDGALRVLIVGAVAFGVAIASFHWFERPLMTWRPSWPLVRRPAPSVE
jgi:peptidoglycan/LPS O-acetylase OafA/YrhL